MNQDGSVFLAEAIKQQADLGFQKPNVSNFCIEK